MTLRGKYALVTGGSRGIGRGIALKLAESGAKVAVHFLSKGRPGQSHTRKTVSLRLGWFCFAGRRLHTGRNSPHVCARQIGVRSSGHLCE